MFQHELKNAYIGDAEPSWTLFTESNFTSSSYWDKLFRRPESWSAASFGTRDTYPVLYINSGSHYSTNILLNSSNHTTLNSHKYIKEVIDYIAFEPTWNTYWWWVGISGLERFRYAYWQRYYWASNNSWTSFIPTSWQWYKIEQIIDTSNMSCTIKFIKLSDNTETTLNYTKQYESFTEWYGYWQLARDQSCNSWLWNIHLYYAD